MKYDPLLIEAKWQKVWEEKKSFFSYEDKGLPKYYILDMFPYPSGAGLHVGHLIGYTATDIVARYKRAQGYSVLHPMGWDSFGLPAEQYAIKTGTHPELTTKENINNFKSQLKAMGYSYDWSREISTSDPSYYMWTQKLFILLYEKGLAYEDCVSVNYCPALNVVLSNEEVENGLSKEGGFPVEKRYLRQWLLKITSYAEKLLEGLDDLDWPENVKKLQRNWIGKSEGVVINFPLSNSQDSFLQVFTTRPETIMGISYIAISPEHSLLSFLVLEEYQESVSHYLDEVKTKSDIDRISSTEKTGVFTGSYVEHPITKELIPIWIADYVLAHFGCGAVMGVPSHDQRDNSFAKKYNLPFFPVIYPLEDNLEFLENDEFFYEGEGVCSNSNYEDFLPNGLSKLCLRNYVISYLEENNLGKRKVMYKLRDWLFSRQRYWGEPIPIIHYEDGSIRALDIDELPLLPPKLDNYSLDKGDQSPLDKAKDWVNFVDIKTGKKGRRETNTMPQWAGSCWYYLRFCDPHNTKEEWSREKESFWMPVDLYVGGTEHAVLHLLYARFWHKVFYDLGLVHTSEPFKKLVNQGLILANSYKIPGGNYLSKQSIIEKNGKYYSQEGILLDVKVEKMSKSKLNGIDPMDIIEEFGADALRMYAMFSGPLDKDKHWQTEGIGGCRRFLNRFFDMATSQKVVEETEIENPKAFKLIHKLIKKISEDIEELSLNTAISSFMEFLNELLTLNSYPKKVVKLAIRVLEPFAPHIAEELWMLLGFSKSVQNEPWPKYSSSLIKDSTYNYVIQVNGKLRGKLIVEESFSQEEIIQKAKEISSVKKFLKESIIKKTVIVPNKLVNFVI